MTRRAAPVTVACQHCGNEFERTHASTRYCSEKCRRAVGDARRRGQYRVADNGYGPLCPDCGGVKSLTAFRCRACTNARAMVETPINLDHHESIITFSNTATGELHTHHCVGEGKAAQIAAGLAYLAELDPDAEWVVSSRCTPQTILADVRRDLRHRPTGGRRA